MQEEGGYSVRPFGMTMVSCFVLCNDVVHSFGQG